jgi:predicted Zn-dependent protease
MLRRIAPIAVIISLLGMMYPMPARAVSTQTEIEMGRSTDEQIVESSVVETDPLLNAYVSGIARNLWKEVSRKDVPYNIKVLKDNTVNAFSTLGGYIYVDEGLVDFVQSDDELAGVLAHETGHIERRHSITLQSKASALGLLFGIASIFSPLIYNFGNIMQAGVIAKMQRADELQADRTGLQLMSRAGYDPTSMQTMLAHLKVLGDSHSDLVTKYLEDHPGEDARISHLVGYPELDPKTVTVQQRVVQAAGDAERARYDYSMFKFQQILKDDPNNTEALLGLGQDQLALGFPNKSQQTLAQAAQSGNQQTRDLANARILSLRAAQNQHINLLKPNIDHMRTLLSAAEDTQAETNAQVTARRDEGRDQLKQVNSRMNALQAPQVYVQPQHGSRMEAVLKNVANMSRALNSALTDAGISISGIGSLEKNKESGLLKESNDILKEMRATLTTMPLPPESAAIVPQYPNVFHELQLADSDMIRTADAARASLTLLDQSLGDVDAFFKALQHPNQDFRGDIAQADYDRLLPQMKQTVEALNNAANAASQANQLYNMARSRQLSARITLLGLGTSPERYATLQYDLNLRFKSPGIDYLTMLRDNLTPGDVALATIVAADIKTTPDEIIGEMVRTKKSAVDIADGHGMHAWPLEIFAGLVFLDYTDDPVKEMQTN